ncbi:DegT/DnrJ/EryC1/StrS family aminotransferase [Fulvivirga sp. 29W222]|uniref:DegT/DnrJ/EryC1/StrS family aminotransferase n=1 Tax=Fulvivirga marina TaxID=2494733 RepID=A0A937G0E5_9BACT|nr:DegT/DnrJ/EryC1/StrS family aminotransferase [Fulvivirga marina]MBL6448342.1 DegT/DnrJ/EryC1/StrS family aminotransferase [Fulvivirga marina]
MSRLSVPFFDIKRQYQLVKKEVDRAWAEAFEKGVLIGGEVVISFERNFARSTQVEYCVSCGNGTDALELALRALGIGPGDEVIIPAFTFFGNAEVVSIVGANIKFVDILESDFTLDPDKLEQAISKRTKAIIATHLYGLPCRMNEILAIARKYDIKVIEDCAQAHGAKLDGKSVGSFGDVGTFSFYPTKNLGAFGDGGALITNNAQLADKIRLLANHGQEAKNEHIIVGRNSRMDVLQAAVLDVKLKYLEQWNERRRQIATEYNQHFAELGYGLPGEFAGAKHVYHIYAIQYQQRHELFDFLQKRDIGVAIHYPKAIHQCEAYRFMNIRNEQFPVASKVADSVLSLPVFPELTDAEIKLVIQNLISFQKGIN